MKEEELLKWFHEKLLPEIVGNGRFAEGGESQSIEKCELEDIERGVSSFASAPCFAKLLLGTPSGTVTRDILIKFQCQDPLFRAKFMSVSLYNNEVTVYNRVLPEYVDFLKNCGHSPELIRKIVPGCFFASNGDGDVEKAVIILDDLRKYGYKLSDSTLELDFKHCAETIKRVAEFHAISFAMKYTGWKPFEELKTLFEEIRPADNPDAIEESDVYERINAQRGIDYLLAKQDSEVPKEYLENFRRIIEPTFKLMTGVRLPREPFSVICHGDFNRNNTLYKYSDGELSDVKLFDFQRTFYGPPSIDLSFFIYMNTSLELREKHFDDLLRIYYSTLIETTAGILKEAPEKIQSWIPFQTLVDDFGRVAVHAYILVAFFLPFMMDPSDFEESFKTQTYREMAEENVKRGGEAASKIVADVIVDFYRRGFYR